MSLSTNNFLRLSPKRPKSVKENFESIEKERNSKKQKTNNISANDYIEVDKKHQFLNWNPPNATHRVIVFKRLNSSSLSAVFMNFITPDLLKKIFDNMSLDDLIIGKSRNWVLNLSVSQIYICLAIYIRIQGLQNQPLENRRNNRPLREAINEAKNHFKTINSAANIPGRDITEKMISLPIFTADYYEDISKNFQSFVISLGETVAGDEKLYHFTGDSEDLRLVPNKPDYIGLWKYELCAPICQNAEYLLWTKMHKNSEHTPVASIVEKWADIVKQFGHANTLLTMDSYYMDNASQQLLAAKKVKYVAAFSPNRFRAFSSILDPKVNKPGEWSGLYNPTTGHSVVHCYSTDRKLGKKYVMSNACVLTTKPKNTTEIPLFHMYKKTFNVCDKFNRKLHDRTWPHKKGGRNRLGDKGAQHDFIFTCILMNTFNAYWYGMGQGASKPDFRTNCEMLADELFIFANNQHLSN